MNTIQTIRALCLVGTATLMTLVSPAALAALKVVATVPEWGALTQALGGDKVEVFVATNALQDPHRIQARPSLIARARAAQLIVATGAELEIGWLPVVQRDSNNPNVQQGRPGYFEAAAYVPLRDIPKSVDRSMGDVHASGNPHIQTDPRNLLPVARALSARMAELDPANTAFYQTKLGDFLVSWQANIDRWTAAAQPLRGVKIWGQHDGYSYLNNWLGMEQIGTLEPLPGVEPTAAHLSEIIVLQQQLQGKFIVTSAYLSDAPAKWLAQRTGLPVVTLPFTVGGNGEAKTLESLYDDTVQRLLKGLQP